jgi:large subunit ribosomal protein L17
MRHQKSGRKLGRNSSHRKAMFRNMVTSLFEHGSIRTTDARAKELRKVADRMVTLGKRDTVHARRHAAKTIQDKVVLHKLFGEIAGGFSERHGGYTRIIKLGNRRGDNAPMSVIELMPFGAPEAKQRKRPVAPKVTKRADIPQTKERFDVAPEPEETPVEAAEEAPVEAAEEAPAEAAEETVTEEEDGKAS